MSAGCAGTRNATPTATLLVTCTDAAWTAGGIPPSGRCRECGGDGLSPALAVRGVPAGTRWLEVRFVDVTAQGLGWPHHHGTLRVAVSGDDTASVPSVRERSTSLPPGVTIAANHGSGHKPKVGYLAPCACDGNNRYVVTVSATDGQRELARGRLELGHCCLQ